MPVKDVYQYAGEDAVNYTAQQREGISYLIAVIQEFYLTFKDYYKSYFSNRAGDAEKIETLESLVKYTTETAAQQVKHFVPDKTSKKTMSKTDKAMQATGAKTDIKAEDLNG